MDWSWSITAIGSGTGGQTPPRPTGLGFNPYQDTLSWYKADWVFCCTRNLKVEFPARTISASHLSRTLNCSQAAFPNQTLIVSSLSL